MSAPYGFREAPGLKEDETQQHCVPYAGPDGLRHVAACRDTLHHNGVNRHTDHDKHPLEPHHDIQGRHCELHEEGLREDSQQVKNGRKKTGTLFLISCLGVPLCMYGGSSVFSWLQFYKLEFIL